MDIEQYLNTTFDSRPDFHSQCLGELYPDLTRYDRIIQLADQLFASSEYSIKKDHIDPQIQIVSTPTKLLFGHSDFDKVTYTITKDETLSLSLVIASDRTQSAYATSDVEHRILYDGINGVGMLPGRCDFKKHLSYVSGYLELHYERTGTPFVGYGNRYEDWVNTDPLTLCEHINKFNAIIARITKYDWHEQLEYILDTCWTLWYNWRFYKHDRGEANIDKITTELIESDPLKYVHYNTAIDDHLIVMKLYTAEIRQYAKTLL